MAASSKCVRSMSKLCRLSRSILNQNTHIRPISFSSSKLCPSAVENNVADSEANNNSKEENNTKTKAGEEVKAKATKEVHNKEPDVAEIIQKKLTDENKKLIEELKEMKDRYMRSLAETENVRNRMKKQVDDAKVFGIQGFCKDLLEVADILNKATESTPQEQLDKNTELKTLFDGLSLTNSQLVKAFSKHGLVPIKPDVGEKFDPFFHEALFEVPASGDNEGGTVAIIQKSGYKLHERTLRPALVGVFKGTS